MAAELTDEREAMTAAYMAFCKDRAPDHNEVGFAYFKAAWEGRAALTTQQATQGAEPEPCVIHEWSSRMCQRGTKSCVVDHAFHFPSTRTSNG